MKDLSVESFETTSRTFHPKFSSEIYLSRIINYWFSIFTLYTKLGAFSLVCVLSAFFLFFLFLLVISLADTNDSHDSREWRVNHYFFCFLLPPAHEYTFNLSRFVLLIFNRSICNYWADSWWDLFFLEICILLGFSLMQLSYWLPYFKLTLWEFELISNYHLSTSKRTTYPTDINTTSHYCLSITPTQP